MENLNLQKTKIERLIEEKLEESERLQRKLMETKEDIEELQQELRDIKDKIEKENKQTVDNDESEELINLFKKACKEEEKKNKKIVKYWAEFGLSYEKRMMKKFKESEGLEISEKEIIEEINKEIKDELPEEFIK